MRISGMRHRVKLLKPVRENDGMGGGRIAYKEAGVVWAEFLRPNFSDSTVHGDADATVLTQGIRTRETAAEKGWLVESAGNRYEVLHVDRSVRGEITLTTREVTH